MVLVWSCSIRLDIVCLDIPKSLRKGGFLHGIWRLDEGRIAPTPYVNFVQYSEKILCVKVMRKKGLLRDEFRT